MLLPRVDADTNVITKIRTFANKKTERFGCPSVNVNKNLPEREKWC